MGELIYIVSTLIALVIAVALIKTGHLHGRHTFDHTKGVQKFHDSQTSRIGGVAIFLAVLISSLVLFRDNHILYLATFSSIPVFLAGLIEDTTKSVRALIRLLFAIISGFIFVLWSGLNITNIDMPLINIIFQIPALSIIITAIALAGITNAVNIIDGYNGLASGSVIIMFAGLAMLGYRADDQIMLSFSLLHFAATFGFFVLNFPYGRIFLGDGGAYFLGFALGANVIALIERNPELSPWTIVLVLAYPLVETLYSMARKSVTPGHSPHLADRIHLHHLLHRAWLKPFFIAIGRKHLANPASGAIMWGYPLLSVICAQIGYGHNILSIILFLTLMLVYIASYSLTASRALAKIRQRS